MESYGGCAWTSTLYAEHKKSDVYQKGCPGTHMKRGKKRNEAISSFFWLLSKEALNILHADNI